ncbi:MAG: Sulfite reductase [NADPH] flavoprotein alpha-component [Luteibacter sp.]|uniref:assimilatory sulfite reductase (NADPH) flavoprotein subunit n=1 Tax=Luteibacter sp. TaxID=1886636 RepID=UPI001386407D|nr:assimilatory sulfite reductase (NADPH) flavoprotein subunit [Luteibacter sp.]KAF1006935.1 MAG: Sulfite reductase [NADPH] flavoprotein alpha-component [Luteibacter sp.]
MNAVVSNDVADAPLDAAIRAELARLAEGLRPAQLYRAAAWLAARAEQPTQVVAHASVEHLTVIYGSQTGNAKRAAEHLVRVAEAAGLRVRLVRADAYPTRELARERFVAVVISTQGDGDPPDDAKGFVEFLTSRRASRLPDLHFSVLALGDSSYPLYCAVGRTIDARLAELGATRFAPLAEADVDVETNASPWRTTAIEGVRPLFRSANVVAIAPVRPVTSPHDRDRPFEAAVLLNQPIVAEGHARDIRHVELSLEGSGIVYEPGDALGVWPRQSTALVAQVLLATSLDGDTSVERDGLTLPLSTWLETHRELTRLSRPFVAALAERSTDEALRRALEPSGNATLREWLETLQPIDLLRRHPVAWTADALVVALRPLVPRLYSIASSHAEVGDEVHLTVSVVDYRTEGEARHGVASAHLATAEEGGTLRVFVERNERFRLPVDPSRDIVMIGPGTGVAPFRAFIQARRAQGGTGRNWLFFGNRHAREDFLYQTEWQAALKDGSLHRLDLAFSRDRGGKVYVQQRLRENAAELHGWLAGGAHLYVCGDAKAMAADVHAALIDAIATHGAKSHDEASAWLDELLREGRYARDVY